MRAASQTFSFDDFVLDPDGRSLTGPEGFVRLRPKSFAVLQCLLEAAGEAVPKRLFFDRVWPEGEASDESLARCIADIRAALGGKGATIVRTLPREGYVLTCQVARRWARDGAMPASADRPTLSVLPFEPVGSDPDKAYLARGLGLDVEAALSRLSEVVVVSAAGLSPALTDHGDVMAHLAERGVRYVVTGSVWPHGSRVRVGARLLIAGTGVCLWAESYDREAIDLFQVLDEITARIVGRLGTEMLAAEHARLRRSPPPSLGSWACVVQALAHASQQSEEETRVALDLLDRALVAEPGYATALGMKAWILVFRAFQGWDDMPGAVATAGTLIAEGLARDNEALWPYLAQGMRAFALRDNGLAVSSLERAVAISPNGVNAHGLLCVAHAVGGRPALAIASLDRARRLSARDTFLSDFALYAAFAHFAGEDYVAGVEHGLQAHALRPRHPYPLVLAGACAGHLGRRDLAERLAAELRRLVPVATLGWVVATAPFVAERDRHRLARGLRGIRSAGLTEAPPARVARTKESITSADWDTYRARSTSA